jgi:hypothetical protein
LRDAVGERRPPNLARRERVRQTLDLARLGDNLGDAAGDALSIVRVSLISGQFSKMTDKEIFGFRALLICYFSKIKMENHIYSF